MEMQAVATAETAAWIAGWKLLGSPGILTKEQARCIPLEAFNQQEGIAHFEVKLNAGKWVVMERFPSGLFSVGVRTRAGEGKMLRTRMWGPVRRIIMFCLSHGCLPKGGDPYDLSQVAARMRQVAARGRR